MSDGGAQADIRALAHQAELLQLDHEAKADAYFIGKVDDYISLHGQVATSLGLLSDLAGVLETFQRDLSSASGEIAGLQDRSHQIDAKLRARARLNEPLSELLRNIVLDPKTVSLFFDTEPVLDGVVSLKEQANQKAAPNSRWVEAIGELERVLDATVKPPSEANLSGESEASREDYVRAMQEAREVAEGCKIMAASKLRPYLIAPLHTVRSKVTTNLQILQTSILLKHYRPLYGFLARHVPRVAIDVQRAYIGAARLYFETGFRRYTRALGSLKQRWKDRDDTSVIADVDGGGALGLGSAIGLFSARTASASLAAGSPGIDEADKSEKDLEQDAWLQRADRLQNALFEGPGIVLAYMADDPAYKAVPEALFRSLSLVFLDNASSEYTFIMRFFEGVGSSPEQVLCNGENASGPGTSSRTESGTSETGASQAGGKDHVRDSTDEGSASVVRLSAQEQKTQQGRGAADALWKQIMEPALGHWTTFSRSLLHPPPPLLPLLTMIRLNDALLAACEDRGCAIVLQSPFLAFKLEAWPILQRQFSEHTESLRRLADGGAAAGETGGLSSFMRAATGGAGPTTLKDEVVRVICRRYARLFSSVVVLSNEQDDAMLFSSLVRMRGELENLLTVQANRRKKDNTGPRAALFGASMCDAVLRNLESGPAPTSQPRIQSELSHWHEQERTRRTT